MNDRFVSFGELKTYFEKERLEKDLEGKSNIGICSVADLLFITEDFKKEITKSLAALEGTFHKFLEGPGKSGQICVADLDRERLSEAMFDDSNEGLELWETAASDKLSPRDSITLLALRVTDNAWWSEEVFDKMCKTYGLNGQ
ncbi:MAG: hypothetical protein MUF15_24670 [Acidobacteria bacterium]|jgi:hypothetical protein|nr:hypothetical protein [Acidobacteriota bacterium]